MESLKYLKKKKKRKRNRQNGGTTARAGAEHLNGISMYGRFFPLKACIQPTPSPSSTRENKTPPSSKSQHLKLVISESTLLGQ
jgi:hypothetical protein